MHTSPPSRGRVPLMPLCRKRPIAPATWRAPRMNDWPGERVARSKACRSASRTCSAPPVCAPRRARTFWKASFPPTNRPLPPICGAMARCCSASSITTSSPWARRTSRPISVRSCRHGAVAARTRNLCRGARQAVRRRRWRRSFASGPPVPIPAARSASRRA